MLGDRRTTRMLADGCSGYRWTGRLSYDRLLGSEAVITSATGRTSSVRHAEIDSRGRRLSGYDDPRATGSASAESVFAMQTNARTLHGSKRAVAPTCTCRSEAAPAWGEARAVRERGSARP